MSDLDDTDENPIDTIKTLRERATRLEADLLQSRQEADARLARSELRAEALRAGIVDLDGLQLLDSDAIAIGSDGHPIGVASHIAKFKHAKPWLFGGHSTTTSASAPASQPIKTRLAMDMSDDEYRAARALVTRDAF